MTHKTLIMASGTIREYKPMGWAARKRYSRQVDRRLRYVCPPDMGWLVLLETLFWVLLAGAAAACVLACPVLFVRWWLCL